ncbi:MAG: hypothetical protein H0W88_11550 [Parachlamydiaceae bacterium]|nr:hypothetical protein [Parachlamydiaceae bacterium]
MSVPPTNKYLSAFSFPGLRVGQGAAASSQTTNIQDPGISLQSPAVSTQTKLDKVAARTLRNTSPQNRYLQLPPTPQVVQKNKLPGSQPARTQSATLPTIFGTGAGAGSAAGAAGAGFGVAESAGSASAAKTWGSDERKADGKSLPKIGDRDSSPSKPTSEILRKYSPEDDTSENITIQNGRNISSASMRKQITSLNHFMELASSYFKQDNCVESIKYINNCLSSHPTHIPALLLKASILIKGSEYNTALTILEQILKIDKNNLNAIRLRGIAYFNKNNYGEAAKNFEFLIREIKGYDYPIVFDLLGRIYRAEKRMKENQFFYEKVIELAPKNVYILKQLVEMLIKLGRYYEAIANINVILQENESDYSALITRANIYYKLEEFDKAKADTNTILKLYPSDKGSLGIQRAIEIKLNRLKGTI